MFAVLLVDILQGVESPGYVYSIMPCGDNYWCYNMLQQVYTYGQ